MNFYVGMKVVCVDAGPNFWGEPVPLVENQIYVIRGIVSKPDCDGDTGLHLVGVEHRPNRTGCSSFKASRFRPLIERSTETGMAILRKVADDAAARRNLVRLDQ